jgi:hypothetical protein
VRPSLHKRPCVTLNATETPRWKRLWNDLVAAARQRVLANSNGWQDIAEGADASVGPKTAYYGRMTEASLVNFPRRRLRLSMKGSS